MVRARWPGPRLLACRTLCAVVQSARSRTWGSEFAQPLLGVVVSLRLETFGGLALAGSAAQHAHQRRRLALLALLAASGERGVSRDQLYAFFWPESSAESARHSLEQLLYALRKALDAPLFVQANPLTLDHEVVGSDRRDLELALARGSLEEAVALHRGPFLDGFHLTDAPEFERWVEAERARLLEQYKTALDMLASAAAATDDRDAAVRWSRMLAAADPMSARAALTVMKALAAAGDSAAALQQARRYELMVQEELGAAPDAAIAKFAAELRAHSFPPHKAPERGAVDQAITASSSATLPVAPHTGHLRSRWPVFAAGAVVVVLALAALARTSSSGGGAAPTARIRTPALSDSLARLPSIVVLPLTNLNADRNDAYFADGMTDELINKLTRIPGLRVIARTSSFAFKGRHTDVRTIAESLGVSNVLEGSLQKTGSRLRLTLQLISAADGSARWSDSYERDLEDVFVVQDEIARAVLGALTTQLAPPSGGGRLKVPTRDLAAFDAYLRGRQQFNVRTDSALRLAIVFYNQAVALDPRYASAYSGIADSYALLGTGNYSDYSPREDFGRARDAANRAIALDDSLAEAHLQLGFIQMLYDFDWAGAERQFQIAMRLDPTLARVHLSRSVLLDWRELHDEAIESARRSQSSDPLSASATTEVGRALFYARRYDESLVELRRAYLLDSNFSRLHLTLGEVYAKMGMMPEAVAALRRVSGISGRSPRARALLAYVLATSGERAEATEILEELRGRWRRGRIGAFDVAVAHAGLGNRDSTFTWLDRSYDDRSIKPILMDPTFDALRSDARFAALMARLRLSR
jgi:TolB-like protein/DNA-binding SARP family transcriptional activator/Tfp pilus assembly protein PilF